MFVLITGSRTFSDREFIFQILERAHAITPIEHLVLGDCPTGTDEIALDWARMHSIPHTVHKADWSVGRKAGPLRNLEMVKHLDSFKGDKFAVAFVDKHLASSRGTNNCITQVQTRTRNIRVKVYQR